MNFIEHAYRFITIKPTLYSIMSELFIILSKVVF